MKQKILWRFVAVRNGSKIPLFNFFSAFAKRMFPLNVIIIMNKTH